MGAIEQKIESLGLSLPEAVTPVANYYPYRISGRQIFISGQLPIIGGKIKVSGHVGKTATMEQAQVAAKLCALNMLAQLEKACIEAFGVKQGLNNIDKVIRIDGYVASAPSFFEQHKVIDAASEMLCKIFGDKIGKHARTAIGVSALPMNATVEIAGIFEINY